MEIWVMWKNKIIVFSLHIFWFRKYWMTHWCRQFFNDRMKVFISKFLSGEEGQEESKVSPRCQPKNLEFQDQYGEAILEVKTGGETWGLTEGKEDRGSEQRGPDFASFKVFSEGVGRRRDAIEFCHERHHSKSGVWRRGGSTLPGDTLDQQEKMSHPSSLALVLPC